MLPKKDDRPRRGAWAPGDYICECIRCHEQFLGDKRAGTCADCGYRPVDDSERINLVTSDFDKECLTFTAAMQTVAGWKHNYLGAAYTTRLRQAISDARAASDHLEKFLNKDDVSHIASR